GGLRGGHLEMRAKTVARLAMLIAILGLVGGAGFYFWQIQIGRMARGLLEQAARAEEQQDFTKAEGLYRESLAVVPADPEVQVKRADALLKVDPTPRGQDEAELIYNEVLVRMPARDDVRRRRAKLALERGRYVPARRDLAILEQAAPDDGEIRFLLGRCF